MGRACSCKHASGRRAHSPTREQFRGHGKHTRYAKVKGSASRASHSIQASRPSHSIKTSTVLTQYTSSPLSTSIERLQKCSADLQHFFWTVLWQKLTSIVPFCTLWPSFLTGLAEGFTRNPRPPSYILLQNVGPPHLPPIDCHAAYFYLKYGLPLLA